MAYLIEKKIVDLPLRRCPHCGTIFLEDDQMYSEPDTCPHCGAALSGNINNEG